MSDPSASGPAPGPSRPRRRWLWVALIVSLAINALLAGVILRAVWQFRAGMAVAGARLERTLPAFIDSLPVERREALRKEQIDKRPEQLRPLRRAVRHARRAAIQAFLADPFDKQAFVAAQDQLLKAEAAFRAKVRVIFPEVAERMTADERRAYLRWHRRARRSHWKRRYHNDSDRKDLSRPAADSR